MFLQPQLRAGEVRFRFRLASLPTRRFMASGNIEQATFGAGCFWGTEKYFKKQFPLLRKTTVGYMGGERPNPSYKDVCTGTTNHAEVLQLEYDPNQVPYEELVRFFFRMHDPTTLNRQGNDRGTQYRSVVFYHSPQQKEIAERVKQEVQQAKKFADRELVTQITPAAPFYRAEDYHQAYLDANPDGYCNHRVYW